MKFHSILMVMLILLLLILPVVAADLQEPVNSTNALNSAGALYSQSVDLANEGKYQEALDTADRALAMNVTSLTGLIQSNRAGILVMLHRDNEAVTAADAALAVEGNLTTVHSIAWYNKGNALRALGRTAEARDAYAEAYALDKTLVPPDLGNVISLATTQPPTATQPLTVTPPPPVTTLPATTTQRSSVPVVVIMAALGVIAHMRARSGKPPG
jgi:tetratricopeptide (TPR) repeat protein